MCAKVFDIYTKERNVHMCLDFEMKVDRASTFVIHFDCMAMGVNGLSFLRPGDPIVIPDSNVQNQQNQTDVYDAVIENK